MTRTPNPRRLTLAFLLLSAALAMVVLSARNLYDDEISTFFLVKAPVSEILRVSAEGDVHPPGMYLLAHLAYRAIPSYRWLNVLPALVLYLGLGTFLLEVVPLLSRVRAQLCVLMLATLHPQLLMWSATFRWYSWWTGLALITLTVALQPRKVAPTLGAGRAASLGLLLAALFYLNYITFLFAFALAVAMLLRYRSQRWPVLGARAGLLVAVFAAAIAPQLHTMLTVHLRGGGAQRYSLAASSLRLLESIAVSEAYLPWHPIAILANVLFFALLASGCVQAIRWLRQSNESRDGILASVTLFGLTFFLLVAATGLGGKPRNGLLLIPALAPVGALIVERFTIRMQTAILLFLALWSAVGIAHMVARHGMTKSTMNDHPDEVVRLVEHTSGPDCSIVVTYDQNLAFALDQARIPQMLVISPFREYASGDPGALPAEGCDRPELYIVHTYIGDDAPGNRILAEELKSSERFFIAAPASESLNFDPEARLKRRLKFVRGAESLPDYRYLVQTGTMQRADLDAMRRVLRYFISGTDPLHGN